jgi:hypothetical protein
MGLEFLLPSLCCHLALPQGPAQLNSCLPQEVFPDLLLPPQDLWFTIQVLLSLSSPTPLVELYVFQESMVGILSLFVLISLLTIGLTEIRCLINAGVGNGQGHRRYHYPSGTLLSVATPN